MQKSVIEQYLKMKGNPTLRAISDDTGIQITRVFRILNGCEMKVSEYQVFRAKVEDRSEGLEVMAKACVENLSHSGIREISQLMERKLRMRRVMG